MFGGLTKTSSRIAIAAALGMVLGGYALTSPAKAQDVGGDCCADLEERVAELEATTVRKGNKKVSVTLSGWVVKSMNWWDDGGHGNFAVGDKDYDLGTRFAITGSATIAPGWSAGYNITVTTGGTAFGIRSNNRDEFQTVNGDLYGSSFGHINTLYSYGYVKSDTWGTLNWGHLSPASDNPAVLADASGTVIESNFVFFEGGGFALRQSKTGARPQRRRCPGTASHSATRPSRPAPTASARPSRPSDTTRRPGGLQVRDVVRHCRRRSGHPGR